MRIDQATLPERNLALKFAKHMCLVYPAGAVVKPRTTEAVPPCPGPRTGRPKTLSRSTTALADPAEAAGLRGRAIHYTVLKTMAEYSSLLPPGVGCM